MQKRITSTSSIVVPSVNRNSLGPITSLMPLFCSKLEGIGDGCTGLLWHKYTFLATVHISQPISVQIGLSQIVTVLCVRF